MTNTNKKVIKGHIRPRPNKENVRYYDVVLEYGVDENGKRIQKSVRVDGTKEDAEAKLIQLQAEYMNDELILPDKILVKTFAKEFLEVNVEMKSASTKKYYKEQIERYIEPFFGNVELQKLNTMQIQRKYNEWLKCSPYSKSPLSPNSVATINRAFKAMLNYAVKIELIKKNPINNVVLPKTKKRKDVEVYTQEELCKLIEVNKGSDMELAISLLIEGALRRGELLGLRYDAVDFENKKVKVDRSLVEDFEEKIAISNCKSESSVREFYVTDHTLSLIKKQLKKYKENKLKQGKNFLDSGYIICKENGEPFKPNSFYIKWKRMLEKNNLRRIAIHDVRHSVITMLMDEGTPVHAVQHLAGHSSATITLDIYTHLSKKSEKLPSQMLQKEIFDKVNNSSLKRAE